MEKYQQLVSKIIQYIEDRIKNGGEKDQRTRIAKYAFFSMQFTMFSVETRKPVDNYMKYAVLDALRKIRGISACVLEAPIYKHHHLNIWKTPPASAQPINMGVLKGRTYCESYFYDPQNIIRDSLKLLLSDYVVFAQDEEEYIRVIHSYKRRHRTPLIVYLEVENLIRELPVYNEPRSTIILKNKDIRECCEIPHMNNPDQYVEKYGHALALEILTSR